MLGIKGEEEEQPASRSAGLRSIKSTGGVDCWGDSQRRMMAMAIRIMRTW